MEVHVMYHGGCNVSPNCTACSAPGLTVNDYQQENLFVKIKQGKYENILEHDATPTHVFSFL